MSFVDGLFQLKDKVVVVTGSNGQLGRTIMEAFKEAGAYVIGFDVDISHHCLSGVEYQSLDIRKKIEIDQALEVVVRKFGRVDVLINNAGVSTFDAFEDRSEEQFDWVTDVNLKGTFFCVQSYIQLFDRLKLSEGAIVNVASLYGLVSPDPRIYTDCARKNSEIYGATKAGVIQMTKYFSVHLASRNIRVNVISPGGIFNSENPQGEDFIKNYSFRCPIGRMAKDKEIIGAVLYLSSSAASYVTGHNLVIDGGFSCW